jgi:hypothetical protein
MDYLVPDRDCGECNLCCIVPAVDKPEIQKAPSSVCKHCVSEGCDIYRTRPEVCRSYYCGWRRMAVFPHDWRPDKSGVLVEMEQERGQLAVALTLVANPLKTVREARFIEFVAKQVARDARLYLGLPGPKGRLGAKLLLNSPEMKRAASGSRAGVKMLLEQALKKLQGHDFQPALSEFSGNDVST